MFYLPNSNIKVIKLEYKTSLSQEKYVYELHKEVYDVHFILSGREYASVTIDSDCVEIEKYNEQADYMLYESHKFEPATLNA